jgi:hypothetical protein
MAALLLFSPSLVKNGANFNYFSSNERLDCPNGGLQQFRFFEPARILFPAWVAAINVASAVSSLPRLNFSGLACVQLFNLTVTATEGAGMADSRVATAIFIVPETVLALFEVNAVAKPNRCVKVCGIAGGELVAPIAMASLFATCVDFFILRRSAFPVATAPVVDSALAGLTAVCVCVVTAGVGAFALTAAFAAGAAIESAAARVNKTAKAVSLLFIVFSFKGKIQRLGLNARTRWYACSHML